MKRAISHQRNALSGELIDDGEDPVGAPIGQLVADEIGRPALIRPAGRALCYSLSTADLLPLHATHLQVLLVVQPIDSLGVHLPAFSPQQHGEPLVPVAHVGCRQLAQSQAQSLLQGSRTGVLHRASRNADNPRGTPLWQPVRLLRPPRQPTPLARLYNFFDTISCRI